MKIDRRCFLTASAAGTVLGPQLFSGCVSVPCPDEVGAVYPGWAPGELDLHFIHTGRGENAFYLLPDGTTVVNDCGDYYYTKDLDRVPWEPKGMDHLLGAEIVARYIRRLTDAKRLDYALVSHWHSDHTGEPSLGSRTTADGRKVCGLALLGEEFEFGRFYDHQFPFVGKYAGSIDREGLEMIEAWLKAKNVPREPFKVGALNQIKLQHDPAGRYADSFSIRNICANAVCWTGKGEENFDYGAVHAKATGKELIPNQNALSMGFVIEYGKFRFWTGGDVSTKLKGADGKDFNWEEVVGKAVGKVNVCKTNHHAWKDAMSKEFVAAVQAQAYISCVWCQRHILDDNMPFISSRALYPGERRVYPTHVPWWPRREWPKADWWKDVIPKGGHIVVKVAPGGRSYKIYVLDSETESLRINSVYKYEEIG